MSVLRTNVDFAKRIFADRVGNPYVYGGNWNPDDTRVGTDCSGLVIDICDAVRNGTRMAWSRHGMSTESWRPIDVGQVGTIFNTICVASPADFPRDAAVKIAIHHGPGGGASSHMWCDVEGVRMESNGSDGCVTGNQAMSVYDTSYANDWHYLPGPIVNGSGTVTPAPVVMTVPLVEAGGGRWTSPNPAWAHLIMRESSGDPTIIQQITDINSGGNEAEGLFQITPRTWRGAGGTEFAASPRHATPQQQALVAARIITANPSGSDWGAGLPGREDAHQLVAGLVPAAETPTGEGFLMALSDSEQREVLDLLRQQSGYRRVSRSPLRHVGEGPTETATGFELNVDGSVHVLLVNLLARLGDPDALNLLREVANADPSRYPDRTHDRLLAQAILNDIGGTKTSTSAPPTGTTPGTITAATPSQPVVVVASNPVPALPAAAPAPSTTIEGGLFGALLALTTKLESVSAQVTQITEGPK